MTRTRPVPSLVSVLAAAFVLLAGCGGRPDAAPVAAPTAEPVAPAAQGAAPAAIVVGPGAAVILARMDAADGARDQVVSNCAGCGLGMPGAAEYSARAGAYTLHFCSDHCRQDFTAKGEQAILALGIPEEAPLEATP
jgi:hypothetical protein